MDVSCISLLHFSSLMQTITQFSHIFSGRYVSCCVGAAVLQPGVTFTLCSTLLLHFLYFLANYLINCTSFSFLSVFVLSIPALFLPWWRSLLEIACWVTSDSVWLVLSFCLLFFFSSWPSCHPLLLSDIILGSEPCAKSSDELEIGSGPCLVTLTLTSETQSSKHASVFFPSSWWENKSACDLRETKKGVGQNNKNLSLLARSEIYTWLSFPE